MLFVGIPVPGTGAWTGTLAASFLDIGFKKSVLAVLLGVLIAGIIMGLASAGVFGAIHFGFDAATANEALNAIDPASVDATIGQ